MNSTLTFNQISEPIPMEDRPPIDSIDPNSPFITHAQREWILYGVARFPGALDPDLIDAYCRLRETVTGGPATDQGGSFINGGWPDPTPYMRHKEIRDLGCSRAVMQAIREIMGGTEYGMHLNLTGWISTERNWHQDDYLNPPFILCNYVAAWLALDDIHPDSGPFQYIPGSHRWPVIRQERMLEVFGEQVMKRPDWPKLTEREVAAACEREIDERGLYPVTYLPKKGDLLLWHGALMHRGSPPNVPGMLRKSLIIHYSALSHRHDMPRRQGVSDGYVFLIGGELS